MSVHTGQMMAMADSREVVGQRATFNYSLEYPIIGSLNLATYSIRRETNGYRYISTHKFNSKTQLSLQTHSFSTTYYGSDIVFGTITYSIEVMDNKGAFTYFNLATVDLKAAKAKKPGATFNVLLLNKSFNLSQLMGEDRLATSVLLSVYFTQLTGTLTGDTSLLDISVEV